MVVCGYFEWSRIRPDLYRLFIYVFPLDIQLSKGEGGNLIYQFNLATFLCLSQARAGIFNVINYVMVFFVFSELRGKVTFRFIAIGGTVDHHCLNFLIIIHLYFNFNGARVAQ